MNKKITKLAFAIYLFFYSLYSYFTLALFPYIHSDEPWLAGLSKAYIENSSIFVTEPFFDLMPRQAHSIKSLFHLLQSVFIRIGGYNIHSVRLLSLFFGIGSLIIFYALLSDLFRTKNLLPLFITILLSLNEQFFYASHFARQEIIMFFILTLTYYLFVSQEKHKNIRQYWVPIILGLSIGFHPNAFIISMMIGLLYLKKQKNYKDCLSFVGILALSALLYIGISFIGNPNFIKDYFEYGSSLGVNASPLDRLNNFKDFYLKLYYQISGSYYLVDLRLFFKCSVFLGLISILCLLYKRQKVIDFLLLTLGFNAALFIIGRYNPTSILFILFPVYLLIGNLLQYFSLRKNALPVLYSSLIVLILLSMGHHMNLYSHYKYNDYSDYQSSIETYLNDDSIILGNLSSGFVYKDKTFYDIRNLAYLDTFNMSFDSYIKERDINTIIYYEEYDYIHRNPEWQILYGDDSPYYEEMQVFITTHCSLVGEIEPGIYGTRIIRYMNDYPFKILIYHVDSY